MKQLISAMPISWCNNLILECQKHNVLPYTGNRDLTPDEPFYTDHIEQKRLAESAGYTLGNSIEFRHYYPNEHFDMSFIEDFEHRLNIESFSSFVSELRPGKCAPWHWDINPLFEKYKDREIVRMICFIDKPKHGQAFLLEDECFYLEPQGSVYQYPSVKSWHAGFNAGLETKFLFTISGFKKS